MTQENNILARIEALERMGSRRRILRYALALAFIVAGLWLSLNLWMTYSLVSHESTKSNEHLFWVICQPGFTPEEKAHAFLRLAAAGNKEWRSAQLYNLPLEGVDLHESGLAAARENSPPLYLYLTSIVHPSYEPEADSRFSKEIDDEVPGRCCSTAAVAGPLGLADTRHR